MLLIFVNQLTARNRYTFKTVFRSFLKLKDYRLTDEQDEFLKHEGPKFSYAKRPLGEELFFESHGLLEQRGITEQQVKITERDGKFFFFPTSRGAMEYDPFAASFFMLSRYEEYLPHLRDHYDRFPANESLAFQHGFLNKAMVDRWLLELKEVLTKEFPEISFEKRKYQYLPTLDIDNAYAYKQKGFIRSTASLLKNIAKFDGKSLKRQVNVLTGRQADPFDTFNYQLNVQKRYKIRPLYFILLGDYGLNDKNLSHENAHFQSLIKSIGDYADLGIHPSFGSNKETHKVAAEVRRLQRITKREVYRSRQHFLKMSLPETYRTLMEADIQEDYTMGFAAALGFRAGTCTPYPFYDLDEEVECKLTIYPFQCMEATLKYYLKLEPEEAIKQIKDIIDEVKAVEGTFISLWHNESLSNEDEWEGWRTVYEEMIEYATEA